MQDDWKVSDALTVNLGLRYDFMTPAYEADNQMANFDPAGAGQLVFAKDGSLEDRALVKPDRNNFSPRLGAVYKLDDAPIVRGGYGIFYNQFDRIGSEDQLALNPPGLLNIDVQRGGNATTPVLFMRTVFRPNFLDPTNVDFARSDDPSVRPQRTATMVQQFGGGFERQIGNAS